VSVMAEGDVHEEQARKAGHYARWSDRRHFASVNFAQGILARQPRLFRKHDPKLRTGFEGSGGFGIDFDAVIANVKAKRVVKLNVSGAFHSPLMAPAAAEFQQVLESVQFAEAKVPVLSNVDPTPATEAATLKQRLVQQMTGSVRWREICLQLPEEGVEKAIEVGPGKVLAGLMKRTCSGVALENCDRPPQG